MQNQRVRGEGRIYSQEYTAGTIRYRLSILSRIACVFIAVFCMLARVPVSFASPEDETTFLSIPEQQILSLIEHYRSGEAKPIPFSLQYGTRLISVQLEPKRNILAHRQARVSRSDQSMAEDLDEVYLFSGIPDGGSSADSFALTISRSAKGQLWVMGYITLGEEHFSLQLAEESASTASASIGNPSPEVTLKLLRHSSSALDQSLSQCGSLNVRRDPRTYASTTVASLASIEPLVLEIATDADVIYVSQYSDIVSANTRIAARLNAVDTIYRAQLNLGLHIVFQHAWESENAPGYPYVLNQTSQLCDPGFYCVPEMFRQFQAYWQEHFAPTMEYDIAHLFTGNVSDIRGLAGIAELAGACKDSKKYGLSCSNGPELNDVSIHITAHEIAHNLGAEHDVTNPPTMMSPTGAAVNSFSSFSIEQIRNFLVSPAAACIRPDGIPRIARQPSEVVGAIGSIAHFSVEAEGAPTLSYQWLLNGQEVTGATSAEYSFDITEALRTAVVKCRVSNDLGLETTAEARVSVPGLPVITGQTDTETFREIGPPFTLRVDVNSATAASYRWLLGGKPIRENNSFKIGNLVTDHTGTSLTLFRTKSTAKKKPFQVEVTNEFGSVLSAPMSVKMGHKPWISGSPTELQVQAGKRGKIRVRVGGTRPFTLQWYRDGVAIPGATRSILKFVTSVSDDGHIYHLVASNPWGTITGASVTLKVSS